MNGISIALAIHSLDPTTNRGNGHSHGVRKKMAKNTGQIRSNRP